MIIVPINRLTPEALQGVIEEFILREGTDYGMAEITFDTKFNQIKNRLEKGHAVLVYDENAETTNILSADDPVLKEAK